MSVLTTKNLNSKLNLKNNHSLVNHEKKNIQKINNINNNNSKDIVFHDLLNALNLREAQLNSNKISKNKFLKNFQQDSCNIQLHSNLKNLSLFQQNLKKAKLDVTNNRSLKKNEKKIAKQKESKNSTINLLNDPFKIISQEFSKKEKTTLENKLNEDNIGITNQLKTSDLIHKAKIQLNQLNSSFDALIKYQKSKTINLSIDQLEFNARNLKYNQNIKAYVDVCCQNQNMVS